MSSPTRDLLAKTINESYELMLAAAVRFNHSQYTEAQRADYSDADVRQMLGGLRAMMLEALEGTDNQTRTLILETMIPGLVAIGNTPAMMSRWVSGYMVALACELIVLVPAEHRAAAADWLADFTAHYTEDTVAAATKAMSAR